VINCWGTWPAEPLHGQLFSDRFIPAALTNQFQGKESFPLSTSSEVQQWNTQVQQGLPAGIPRQHPSYTSYLLDHYTSFLWEKTKKTQATLTVAYFQGLDILQRATPPYDLENLEHLSQYYQFLDELLGSALSSSRLALLAGPGFLPQSNGLFFVRGEGFVSQKEVSGSFLKVMPTLLQALGLPTSSEFLEGFDFFTPDFQKRYPWTQSFGKRLPASPSNSPSVSLEQYYRTLGYLSSKH
jgi:hypothetical protein